jgi:hypothetical protein
MSLKDRVSVEGLEEERWNRIEREVVASVRTRGDVVRARRGWMWAAAAGTVVAAGVIGVIALSGTGTGTGTGTGEAPIVVATDAKGTTIDLGGAKAIAAAETSFTVTRPGGGVDIVLARGRIDLDVPHRPDRAPLVVHAGDVDVIDVGTVFSVTRGEVVSVEVEEGEVQVARGGRVARVAAGQRWSEPMVASAAPVKAPAVTANADAAAVAKDRGAGSASAGAVKDPLARKHVASAPGAGSAKAERATPERERDEGSGTGTSTGTGTGSDVIMDLARAIRAEPIAAAVRVDGGDPFAAYQDMMLHATGGTASQGLYGMARTRFAAGAYDDAMRWLDAYLDRFPRGGDMEAVLWLRVRIRCQAGFDDRCREAAQTYLDRYPGGHRAHIAELVTNTR